MRGKLEKIENGRNGGGRRGKRSSGNVMVWRLLTITYDVLGTVTDLVDSVADGEQIASLGALDASFFLQQSDDQRSSVVGIALVSVDHRDAVLRVRPERICPHHRTRQPT